mmetsp:Transcript_366/g.1195  ORF Transcript_366/g.1195 Transcript_366/m.1195 type:complete len:118 (-) Transcript_366:72-425(-)
MAQQSAIKLRFCPESNDLLFPREDKARKKLIFYCKNCDYVEDADDACVHRNIVNHTAAELTVVMQDVRADPTLPRTKEVECAKCAAREAVFFSSATAEGMTLFFQCTSCGHKWQDYV